MSLILYCLHGLPPDHSSFYPTRLSREDVATETQEAIYTITDIGNRWVIRNLYNWMLWSRSNWWKRWNRNPASPRFSSPAVSWYQLAMYRIIMSIKDHHINTENGLKNVIHWMWPDSTKLLCAEMALFSPVECHRRLTSTAYIGTERSGWGLKPLSLLWRITTQARD